MRLKTLVGLTWTVRVNNFKWTYKFANPNRVVWTETNRAGTWQPDTLKVHGKYVDVIKITWPLSNSSEAWIKPLDTDGIKGTLFIPNQGGYDLIAQPLNFVEVESEQVEQVDVEDLSDYIDNKTYKELCSEAQGVVNGVVIDFQAWYFGFGGENGAYTKAWKEHKDLIDSIAKSIQAETEWVANVSYAFLAGMVGSLVGSMMKKAIGDEVIVDGIKELAKLSVKGLGGVLTPKTPEIVNSSIESQIPKVALNAHPDSKHPEAFPGAIAKEVFDELSRLNHLVEAWKTAHEAGSPGFPLNPVEEVKKSLRVGDSSLLDLHKLQINNADLQKQFQKGWLEALIKDKTAHSIIDANHGVVAAREKFLAYNKDNDLQITNINALLDTYYPVTVVPGPIPVTISTPDFMKTSVDEGA